MRFNKFIILIIVIFLLLISCGDKKMETTNYNEATVDMQVQMYNDEELAKIINFKNGYEELMLQYPTKNIRRIKNDNLRISYWGKDKVAVILFDKTGNKLWGKLYNTSKNRFQLCSLEKGTSIEQVLKIDPIGEYLFLYAGRNDLPRESFHYSCDGYLTTIYYDEEHNICDITTELI